MAWAGWLRSRSWAVVPERRDRYQDLGYPPPQRFRLLAHRGPGRLDLRLHPFEVEARALLHRRELDRGHGQLLDLLLDQNETPEFVLVPFPVLQRSTFGAIFRPTRAFERVETKIDDRRHFRLDLVAEPTAGLVDESILVVADAHGAEVAFAEIPDLIPV